MSSISPEISFQEFLDVLVPLFADSLLVGESIDRANRYKIPPRMMEKGSTAAHAHALPPSFPLDTPALIDASVNDQWVLFFKLANLSRSLVGKKSSKDVGTAMYYLLKALPHFKMPWEIVNSDFLRASNQDGLTPSQRFRMGAGLSYIGKLYNKYGLASQNIKYTRNPHPRPERSSKPLLPDLESCRLLAEGFKSPNNTFETLVTSAFALLNYAPSRASEIVTLDINCVTDLDGFGLRFPSPAKNGTAIVKRAPCVEFEQIVRVAVDRLITNSKVVREVAAWYAINPDELYFPDNLKGLRNKSYFCAAEALAIIGYGRNDGLTSANLYAHRQKSPMCYFMPPGLSRLFEGEVLTRGDDVKVPVLGSAIITRDRLLSWVKSHFGTTFPYVDGVSGVFLKDSIFVYPFSSVLPVSKIFWQCEYVPDFFSSPKLQLHFNRLFFRAIGREDLSLGTHMMRHLLNTLAQTKHIDQRIIAMWSGRSSVEQNSDYDHRTMEEKTETIDVDSMSLSYEFGGFLNDLYNAEYQSTGISTEQFFKEAIGSLHVTELGFCRHNYVSGPCPNVFQCVDCPEHCFTKSERSRAAAGKMIQKLTPVIESARVAAANHEPGADKFLEVHERKLSRYQRQLDMCEAVEIPADALCAMPPTIPQDNLLSKSLKWREDASEELTRKAHENGRVCGYSRATIEKIRTLPNVWMLEIHGLPTWKAICDFLEVSCGLKIRRGGLLLDDEITSILEKLAVRLLQSPLVYRDSSLRWYWNFRYLTAEVLKDWDYDRLNAPSCTKVADEINRLYPFVNATKFNIEKNKSTTRLILQKRQELQDEGYIYLSRQGRVLSERALFAESSEKVQINNAFTELCRNWDLADGLPNKKTVLSIFSQKYGFDLSVSQLNSNLQLLTSFRTIKKALDGSRFVQYDCLDRPRWKVLNVIELCAGDVSSLDAGSLYDAARARFSGFHSGASSFPEYVSQYVSGERE